MSSAHEQAKAGVDAARAILGAFDRGVLDISADYLADTLRMLLSAVNPLVNPVEGIEVRPLAGVTISGGAP